MRSRLGSGGTLLASILAMASCGGTQSASPLDGGGVPSGAGGTGGATGAGGTAGSAGATGAGGAAGAGGTAAAAADGGTQASGCGTNALTTCPGTTSGPWCVENLFTNNLLTFPTNSSVWSDGPADTWVVGFHDVSLTNTTTSGYAFHWDGCAWTETPLPGVEPSLAGVWGTSVNDVWAVGAQGTALHWAGGGWSAVPVGAAVDLESVSGTGPGDVWTSGGFHWNGSAWSQPAPGGPGGDVWAVAPNDVWATSGFVAPSPNVWHFDGSTWTSMRAAEFVQFGLFAIWADAITVWAAGEGSQVAHFANGVWTQVAPPGGSSVGFVDIMQSGQDVYAVGIGVAHAVVGGSFTRDPDAPAGINYSGVWLTPSQVWVAGDRGTVIHKAR